ncbi:MAG: sugar ABC transporter substrate-binding protein [Candidatus Omnitrophica bacterium]|nr:sugar ABC transporter substrate-binding protein [Candidatus Omnitrophota bacterium]
MKKKQLVYFFLLSFLVGLTGCGQNASQDGITPIKVAFWGSPEEIDIITNSIKGWQTEHPQIKIIFEHTPYTGYDSKILTRIAGGAAPDIIATEVDYFVTFASKNVLEELAPFIEKDTVFSQKDFFPTILHRFTVDGKILAIPRDVAPFACVFYNKDLFDKAGLSYPTDDWTWDDLLRYARALTKKDATGHITQYGFYGWAWQNFVYGNGGALVDSVDKPTRTAIDDPKTVQGIQFYADLVNLYHVMPTPSTLSNLGMGVDLMFASGRLAMFLSGIWETPGLRNYNFHWDVVMFPKNPQGMRAFGSGGSGYAMLKSSQHKEEAWEVIKALTGAGGQAELAKRGLAQPSRIEVAQSDSWAKNTDPPANKQMLNQAVNFVTFSPFHPKWREINDKYIAPQLDLVFNGKQTAQEAVQKIAPHINAVLQSHDL